MEDFDGKLACQKLLLSFLWAHPKMTKILIFYQWFWRNPDDFDEPVKIPLLLILDSSKFSIQKLTPFPNSVAPSHSTYCLPFPSRFLLPLSFLNRPWLLFLSLQHAEVIFVVVQPTIPPQWHNHQRDWNTPLKGEGSHWSISVPQIDVSSPWAPIWVRFRLLLWWSCSSSIS